MVVHAATRPRAWSTRAQESLRVADGRLELVHAGDRVEVLAAAGELVAARWRTPPAPKAGMHVRSELRLAPLVRAPELLLTRVSGEELVLPLDGWSIAGAAPLTPSQLRDVVTESGLHDLASGLGLELGHPDLAAAPEAAGGSTRRLDPLAAPRGLRWVVLGYLGALLLMAVAALAALAVPRGAPRSAAAAVLLAALPLAWLYATGFLLLGQRRMTAPLAGLVARGAGGQVGLDSQGDVVVVNGAGFESHLRGPASGSLQLELGPSDLSFHQGGATLVSLGRQGWEQAELDRLVSRLRTAGVTCQEGVVPGNRAQRRGNQPYGPGSLQAEDSATAAQLRGPLSRWPAVIMFPGWIVGAGSLVSAVAYWAEGAPAAAAPLTVIGVVQALLTVRAWQDGRRRERA